MEDLGRLALPGEILLLLGPGACTPHIGREACRGERGGGRRSSARTALRHRAPVRRRRNSRAHAALALADGLSVAHRAGARALGFRQSVPVPPRAPGRLRGGDRVVSILFAARPARWVDRSSPCKRGQGARSRFCGAAGTAWALAVGCRVSVLFAVAALVPITALAASHAGSRSWRHMVLRAAALGTPLAVVLACAGRIQRGAIRLRFRLRHRLHADEAAVQPAGSFRACRTCTPISCDRFTLSCEFPFVGAPFFAHALTPAWVPAAAAWIPQEPVVGLLVAIPGLGFAVVALGAAWSRARQVLSSQANDRGGGLLAVLAGRELHRHLAARGGADARCVDGDDALRVRRHVRRAHSCDRGILDRADEVRDARRATGRTSAAGARRRAVYSTAS